MALPRTQTEACQQFVRILHPKVGAGQIAPGFCTPKVGAGQIARDFVKSGLPQGWCWTNRPGFCTPKVGAGQNVPEFCKAGIRLNKIMGKIVMGQKRSQKCKDIKLTWQFRLVSFHLS